MNELWLYRKWWKEKLLLQIQSINVKHPNEENVIVLTITKRMEIITSFQDCLISWMSINYKENGRKQSLSCKSEARRSHILMGEHDCSANNKKNGDFLQIQSINIVYPNYKNMVVMPITKRMEIIMSIQDCLISRININYRENNGKKSFSYKSKALILCILMTRTLL